MSIELLFIHPTFPGQFERLVLRLRNDPRFRLTGLCDATWTNSATSIPGLNLVRYPTPDKTDDATHLYARPFDQAVRRGMAAAMQLLKMKTEGYEPHVIYVHPGWGDALYLKELFPDTPVVGLFEYFYNTRGADVGFDPMTPLKLDDVFRVPMLNAPLLLSLQACDVRLSPTDWQRSLFPPAYRDTMRSLHEGVYTDVVKPDPQATFTLANGTVLRAGDEVLTYACRGFEPYRGVHVFMQALPRILEERPNCQVLIVGTDKVFYGPAAKDHPGWLAKCMAELQQPLDSGRVHFTGHIPYPDYLRMQQVSRAHVYMTYPFVLSWSMLEAMAAGCLVVASDTQPVREMIADEVNGLLFPFFDQDALVRQVTRALASPQDMVPLREAAVTTIKLRYDFERIVLPQHIALIESLTSDSHS